jgi:hypothetical protein
MHQCGWQQHAPAASCQCLRKWQHTTPVAAANSRAGVSMCAVGSTSMLSMWAALLQNCCWVQIRYNVMESTDSGQQPAHLLLVLLP